ncbi:hypothetical protein NFI96_028183, partial [Prochilodus magdalenae]
EGTLPKRRLRLKMCCRGAPSSAVQDFSSLGHTLSGPAAFLVWSLLSSPGLRKSWENENNNKEIEDSRQENENLKSEIKKLRTQLQDSQNELHNFKERMGKVVDLKLGSSGVLSEDLTNPCRESELKRMYEKLSKNQWAKLLRQLKTGGPEMTTEKIKEERKKAEAVIKDVLRKSQDDIQNITGTMLCLTPSSQDDNSKTTLYFDMAVQNLQIAIFQDKKELYNRAKDQTAVSIESESILCLSEVKIFKDRFKQLQDVPEVLLPMIDDCYKTGCLMALHNPPLLLDWDSCGQGPFPPLKTSSEPGAPIPPKNQETVKSDLADGREEDEDVPRKSSEPGALILPGNRETVKSDPADGREEDKDVPRKSSEPGTLILPGNRETVKSDPADGREEDKDVPRKSSEPGTLILPGNRETVKSVPIKESKENTDVPRKLPAAQPGVRNPPKNHQTKALLENTVETDLSQEDTRVTRKNMPCLCIIL